MEAKYKQLNYKQSGKRLMSDCRGACTRSCPRTRIHNSYGIFATVALALMLVISLSGCTPGADQGQSGADTSNKTYRWKMVTSWPKNFPGLGSGPENFVRYVEQMSNGRLRVKLYAGGELVPALEVFDAVSRGVVEMGHSGSYYDKGKVPAAQLFTGVPFGLNAREMSAWIKYGGGQELFDELYAEYNIVPLIGGNTGVQMMGWFNKEINSLDDMKGLRIRMPGVAGDVLAGLGAQVVTMPVSELYTAMQTGVLDAVEWVGPYNDLAIGLHEVAKYYYYPGWHEPGSALYFGINRKAWDSLPDDLQAIVRAAARASSLDMMDEYTARNGAALKALVEQHGVQLRALPKPVIDALRVSAKEKMDDLMQRDPRARKIYESAQAFVQSTSSWHKVSEQAYLELRE
jgi:TRAP-type mannitol/chloroaromatic compound transport system substrate-binding protein